VWPILLFVVAVTIVAELAAQAGVFDAAAARLARLSRGRVIVLWLAVVAFAAVVTAFLSLDTTAVLLTPVVVAVARSNGLSPMPFVRHGLAGEHRLALPAGVEPHQSARRPPARRSGCARLPRPAGSVGDHRDPHHRAPLADEPAELRGRFSARPPRVVDPALLRIAAVVLVVMLPFLVIGIPPWMPAVGAALVLAVVFSWRSPTSLRWALVPWQLVVFASGLFLAVGAPKHSGPARSSPPRRDPVRTSFRSGRSPAWGCWGRTSSTICPRISP
jgi:arsenical pump membrane protein